MKTGSGFFDELKYVHALVCGTHDVLLGKFLSVLQKITFDIHSNQ